MDYNGLNAAFGLVIGVMSLVGAANLVDFYFRNLAEVKAERAEAKRMLRWGLPAPVRSEEPRNDDHLWHF